MFSKGKGTGGPSATDGAPAPSTEAPRSTQGERPRASIGGVPSIISADLTITGNLHSDGDIQIDGQVDGDVLSRSLTIGQGAKVKGTVRADEVKIAGNLKGEVHAARVSITSTARVTGDVLHKSLSIESGAYIDGLCRRIEDPKAASASTAPSASAPAGGTPSSAPKPAGNGEAKPAEPAKPVGSGGLNLEGKA
ncbi:bactofilin family protein [Limibacillus halophilus]